MPHNRRVGLKINPVVLPISLNSFGLISGGKYLIPSTSSILYIILQTSQAILWYPLPSGQGFTGTHMCPGQVRSLTDSVVDSSRHETCHGEKKLSYYYSTHQ